MDAISQTTFSNAFSWMKIHEFRLRCHWSLFVRFKLTIFQATSHYLNQWWLVYWPLYAWLGLNELNMMQYCMQYDHLHLRLLYRAVSGIVTYCPCGVQYCGLTTCLLYFCLFWKIDFKITCLLSLTLWRVIFLNMFTVHTYLTNIFIYKYLLFS